MAYSTRSKAASTACLDHETLHRPRHACCYVPSPPGQAGLLDRRTGADKHQAGAGRAWSTTRSYIGSWVCRVVKRRALPITQQSRVCLSHPLPHPLAVPLLPHSHFFLYQDALPLWLAPLAAQPLRSSQSHAPLGLPTAFLPVLGGTRQGSDRLIRLDFDLGVGKPGRLRAASRHRDQRSMAMSDHERHRW